MVYLKSNFNVTKSKEIEQGCKLNVLKTLPVFVIKYGQAVCRTGEYR